MRRSIRLSSRCRAGERGAGFDTRNVDRLPPGTGRFRRAAGARLVSGKQAAVGEQDARPDETRFGAEDAQHLLRRGRIVEDHGGADVARDDAGDRVQLADHEAFVGDHLTADEDRGRQQQHQSRSTPESLP